MFRLTSMTGFRLAVVAMIPALGLIAVPLFSGSQTTAKAQDEIAAPPKKDAMEKFMARKLAAAQSALEALARDDFKRIGTTTAEMIELSRLEAWERMASPRFVQDTVDFVSAAEFLSRMAEAKDAEGASLGFVRLTMTCTNCHNHVRSSKVALREPDVPRSGSESVAVLSPASPEE